MNNCCNSITSTISRNPNPISYKVYPSQAHIQPAYLSISPITPAHLNQPTPHHHRVPPSRTTSRISAANPSTPLVLSCNCPSTVSHAAREAGYTSHAEKKKKKMARGQMACTCARCTIFRRVNKGCCSNGCAIRASLILPLTRP